jgi:[acyl-carrier-protein] S-malonyltransferase
MTKAFVFSGQGSQYVGMGKDLYENYPVFRDIVEQANHVLKRNLRTIVFEGPEDVLTMTNNAQPALLTMDYGIYAILEEIGLAEGVKFVAGHSLGEYPALVAAGVLSFEDALYIVNKRSELMAVAGEEEPGTMAAIMGLDMHLIASICEGHEIDVANFNYADQIVISGKVDNVLKAMEACKTHGAKRAVQLNVSGAFHSRLMQNSGATLAETIMQVPFNAPKIPVVMNVIGEPVKDPDLIRRYLIAQVSSPVKWLHSMQYMVNHGVTRFIECGPKNVLSGMVRRIDGNVEAFSTDTISTIKSLAEVLV